MRYTPYIWPHLVQQLPTGTLGPCLVPSNGPRVYRTPNVPAVINRQHRPVENGLWPIQVDGSRTLALRTRVGGGLKSQAASSIQLQPPPLASSSLLALAPLRLAPRESLALQHGFQGDVGAAIGAVYSCPQPQ